MPDVRTHYCVTKFVNIYEYNAVRTSRMHPTKLSTPHIEAICIGTSVLATNPAWGWTSSSEHEVIAMHGIRKEKRRRRPVNMWLDNIKDWIALSVDILLGSSKDRTH